MAFTGPQYWAQRNQQQFQTPVHHAAAQTHHNHLNPSVSSFQPNGTEVQRYQGAMPPTPPPDTLSARMDMMQMQSYMLRDHVDHTHDITRLERKGRENADEIRSMHQIVGDDMRALQRQLVDLKAQVEAQMQQHGVLTRSKLVDQDLTPPKEFTDHYSKESIAEAYLDEAEDYEKTAAKLREQAEELCSDVVNRNRSVLAVRNELSSSQHAPNGTREAAPEANFVCCGTNFASIMEMLEHVSSEHSLHTLKTTNEKDQNVEPRLMNGGGDETPTHQPPHRAKSEKEPEKSRATNVEVPNEDNEKTPVQKKTAVGDDIVQVNGCPPEANEVHETSLATASATAVLGKQAWQPRAVRQMPPTEAIATSNTETFTFDLIKINLGGEEWSPGFYFIKSSREELPIRSYWVLERDFEPHVPSAPGHHGAKLTVFFNEPDCDPGQAPQEEDYQNVPVFICNAGKRGEYMYFGHYSQTRYSDIVDMDHLHEDIPEEVLHHHAEELANVGRPQWVTEALMKHFWPMPEYSGPLPTDSAINTPRTEATLQTDMSAVFEKRVMRGLADYAEDLKKWEKDAKIKVNHITAESLITAFSKPDSDEEPGLRLWLEYFQFMHYDEKFYNFMVKAKKDPQTYGPQVNGVGGKFVKPKNGVQTLNPASGTKPFRLSDPNTIPTEESELKWVNGTKSAKTAIKTETKDKAKYDAAKGPSGDMDVAKKLQEDFKKAGGKGKGAGRNGMPPHLRGK